MHFWYGNNKAVYDPETFGSTGGIVLSGSDWLGIGALSEGTAMCGSKPMCFGGSGSACAERKKSFQECVNRSLSIAEQQVAQGASQKASAEKIEKTKRNTIIAVTALVAVAVVLSFYFYTRRKK
jgi:hypothetical protein